jgi:hypothetical protein
MNNREQRACALLERVLTLYETGNEVCPAIVSPLLDDINDLLDEDNKPIGCGLKMTFKQARAIARQIKEKEDER